MKLFDKLKYLFYSGLLILKNIDGSNKYVKNYDNYKL